MTTVVVFNAPPGAGKTTASEMLFTALRNRAHSVHRDSFAAPMKHFIAVTLGEKYHSLKKDEPHEALKVNDNAHDTPRYFLTALSELWLKPRYGKGVFGQWLAARALQLSPPPDFILVDSSGFKEELIALRTHFPDLVLVRIQRPGYDFSGDSRSYLTLREGRTITIQNDQDLDFLRFRIDGLAYSLSTGAW